MKLLYPVITAIILVISVLKGLSILYSNESVKLDWYKLTWFERYSIIITISVGVGGLILLIYFTLETLKDIIIYLWNTQI